jgi:hypothetical protein
MVMLDIEGVEINFISFDDLIHAKKTANRPKDILDVENLTNKNTQT